MSKQIGIPSGLVLVAASAAFVLSWSSGFLAAKVGTAGASAQTVLLWRFLAVAVVLGVTLAVTGLARGRRTGPRFPARAGPAAHLVRPRAAAHHVAVGLLSQVGYVLPVYGAIGLGVSTGATSLVDAVQPVLVATLVGPLLGLHVRGAQWLGLGTAFGGVTLLVAADVRVTTAPAWAYVLPLVAVASLVAATFLERRRPATLPATPMLALHTAVAAVALGVLTLATGTAAPPADPSFWASVAFLALVPSLAAYGLYWYLLRRVDVTLLNALLFLVVPTTTLAGAAMFGEPLTAATAAGLVLAGLGVAAVIRAERRPPRRAPDRAVDQPADQAVAAG